MSKYQKLDFESFSKESVVNENKSDKDNGIEDFINIAVQEHLKKIVPKTTKLNDELSDLSIREFSAKEEIIEAPPNEGEEEISDEALSEADSSEIKEGQQLEDTQSNSPDSEDDILEPETIEKNSENNLEDTNAPGNNDEKADILELDEVSNEEPQETQDEFAALLTQKIEDLTESEQIYTDNAKLLSEVTSALINKLYASAKTDYEKMLEDLFNEKLEPFYKKGDLVVTVHPERQKLCSKILHSEKIPDKFKNYIKIEVDEQFNKDDCIVNWNDAIISYNKEQIIEEVDYIIKKIL